MRYVYQHFANKLDDMTHCFYVDDILVNCEQRYRKGQGHFQSEKVQRTIKVFSW